MYDKVIEIMSGIRPDIDFMQEHKLMDEGLLDSFDLVSLISELNDEFNIAIRVTELKPENFNSAAALVELIKRLQSS